MDDKKAIQVLLDLLQKYPLSQEEKEAISSAIGVLSWTTLGASRIKAMKDKRDKDRESSE